MSLAYFSETPAQIYNWSDGIGHRNRKSMLVLFCKNKAVKFEGMSISGFCTSRRTGHNKNGKWSSTSYELTVAEGVKIASLSQDWNTGNYVDKIKTVASMQEDLKLIGLNPTAAEEFIKTVLPNTWERHMTYRAELMAMEELSSAETIIIEYDSSRGTKREGWRHLLVNGEVWDERNNPIAGVVIEAKREFSGMGGGGCIYKLIIPSDWKVEFLVANAAYDNEGLDSRGYIFNQATEKWEISESTTEDNSSDDDDNKPFKGLFL